MSHSHNFTKTSAVTSVITTEQSAVILNNVHCQVLYWLTGWPMITDQANAAAESNGRFFNKMNRFAQNESANPFESRIGMLYWTVVVAHKRIIIPNGRNSIYIEWFYSIDIMYFKIKTIKWHLMLVEKRYLRPLAIFVFFAVFIFVRNHITL